MGPERKFKAVLVIQDGLDQNEVGRKYLIQVDTEEKGGRFFIDATPLVFRVLERSLPKEGELWLDGKGEL